MEPPKRQTSTCSCLVGGHLKTGKTNVVAVIDNLLNWEFATQSFAQRNG
jgi:hypothetical protein